MFNITRDNSSDLGFVIGCLFSQAITINEFRIWIDYVIEITPVEYIPEYIFDLVDFDGYLYEICNIIGYVPSNNLDEKEISFLEAIAFLRNFDVYEPNLNKDKSIDMINENLHIISRFQKTFPFIDFNPQFKK